jgi:hypothetical protein
MRDHPVACLLIAAVLLAACGAPAHVKTLDHTGDFGGAPAPLTRTLPAGLSDVGVDGPRLVAGCTALDAGVASLVPDVGGAPQLVGSRCEWSGPRGTALVVGMIDHRGAGADLDETILFTDHERSVASVGTRAEYDPDTHALYVVISDRLWYVQLVGTAATDPSAFNIVVTLARSLAAVAAAH